MIKPFLSFTIIADTSTHLRFRVVVWRTFNELQAARQRARNLAKLKPDGIKCDGFLHRSNRRDLNEIVLGEIHFAKTHLTVNTIAHEATHAAIALATWCRPRYRGGSSEKQENDERDLCITENTVEEAICYPTGHMTEGIIWELRRNKLKIKPL